MDDIEGRPHCRDDALCGGNGGGASLIMTGRVSTQRLCRRCHTETWPCRRLYRAHTAHLNRMCGHFAITSHRRATWAKRSSLAHILLGILIFAACFFFVPCLRVTLCVLLRQRLLPHYKQQSVGSQLKSIQFVLLVRSSVFHDITQPTF